MSTADFLWGLWVAAGDAAPFAAASGAFAFAWGFLNGLKRPRRDTDGAG